jgi:hypothetical protein
MSEDPKGFDAGDYNLFRYCKNDPEDLVDPMGLLPFYCYAGAQPLSDGIVGYDVNLRRDALEGLHEATGNNYHLNPVLQRVAVTGASIPWENRNGSAPTGGIDFGHPNPGNPDDPDAPVYIKKLSSTGNGPDKQYVVQVSTAKGPYTKGVFYKEGFQGPPETIEGNIKIDLDKSTTSVKKPYLFSANGKILDHVKAGSAEPGREKAWGTVARKQYYNIITRDGLYYRSRTPLTQVYKYKNGVPVGAFLEGGD